MQNAETHNKTPLFPVRRPCGAKTRAGTPCKNWSMANGRCRMHGGRSTGPKTQRGMEAIRKAHLKHGQYATNLAKRKHMLKHIKLWRHIYGSEIPNFLLLNFWKRLKKMPWSEFCERRARFMEYYRRMMKKKAAIRGQRN